MSTKVNVNGEWKNQSEVFVNVEGDWKRVVTSYANIEGEWKQSTLGGAPDRPILNWNSTGTFKIVGYKSYLVYTPTLVSGSGSANLDPSTGIFILTGVNSAFNVTASYAVGAPESSSAYIERKARTTKPVFVGYGTEPCGCVPNRRDTCNDAPGTDSDCCRNCPSPSYDGQIRCICWIFGSPDPLCYEQCINYNDPKYEPKDDTKWKDSPYFYIDRTTEWSKEL